MDALRAEAFAQLKPFCVQLTKEHTRVNIASLFTALQSVDMLFLQDLQEYVIFPLRVILKHPKKCSKDLYLDLFTCMEYVLGNTKITRWDLFQDIFSTAINMMSCPTDQSKVAKLTEELKIAIIQTVRTLVKNAEYSVIQHLYKLMCLPLLGHAVSLLLNIAEVERARNLRILAMECLLDLSQADSKYSQCMKADIGSIYASFLPGVSVTLCKIITGDTKQGYAVTAKAIYVWMRVVSLVMDDKLLDVYRQKSAKQEATQKDLDPRLQGLIVARDSKWVTTTGGNLAILVKQVATVRSHSNCGVRLGLIECAEHLLLHCISSMKDCVSTFLEILVSMIGDDYSKVASGSRHALELFSQSQATDQQRHLTEILEENLHKLTTSLPRQIQTAEEEDKLSLLNLLSGYLSLLGSKIKSLLLSLPHLKRLSLALVQILELECTDIKIIEERTSITGHGSSAISEPNCHGIVRPRKYFKHFQNDKIYERVRGVCHLLGYYGDIHLLMDHFLDIFHESSMFKTQATLIMNEIMLGTTGEGVSVNNTKNGKNWTKHSQDELDTVVRMLVDEYLSPANFDLVTSITNTRENSETIEQQLQGIALTNNSRVKDTTAAKINRNILQLSLFIEGFGNFSKVLRIDYAPILMTVLYPLLERLGDDTAYISNTSFIALWDICDACHYKSIDYLVRDNADYLINAISLRLRKFHMHKRCPLVLKVMLQYSSAELLPLIDDTITEILDSLDDNYDEDSVVFMGVLNELTKAVVRWFPVNTVHIKDAAMKSETGTGEVENMKQDVDIDGTSCDGCKVGDSGGCDLVCANMTCKCNNPSTTNSSGDCQKAIKEDHKKLCTNNSCGLNSSCNEGTQLTSNLRVTTEPLCGNDDCEMPVIVSRESILANGLSRRIQDLNDKNVSEILPELLVTNQKLTKNPTKLEEDVAKLMSYFTDLLKLESEAEGELSEEELNNFSPDLNNSGQYDDAEEDVKIPVPRHVLVVKEVMLRCKHILASCNPRLRLLVLDTIGHVCLTLQAQTEELLPLIHQIWPAFSLCFVDDEKMVTIKAINILQIIARSSGDFVRQRIIKDVLPKLANFLQNQAEISVHAGSAYQFTANYKLQLAVLSNISTIAKLSCICGSDLDMIVSSCVPYLNSKQPATLQNACYECCRQLIQIDADLLWLHLCHLYCPKTYIPPDDRFKEIKVLKQTSTSNNYSANITKLLCDLEEL